MNLKNKKTFIHAAGAISYAFSQWLILTFSTRFISLESAGLYAYYLGIFTPAAILLSFGLRNAIASDAEHHYTDYGYKKAQFIGITIMTIYALIIMLIVKDDLVMGALVFFIKGAEMYSEVIYGSWVRDSNAEKYGISKILKLLVFLPLFLIFYIFLGSNKIILFAYPLAILFVIYFYDKRKSSLNTTVDLISKKYIFSLIRISLPLAVGSFIISLNSSVPRILIKNLIGEQKLALYVILTYFISLAIIPIMSLCQIYTPYFSKIRNSGTVLNDKKIKEIFILILGYGVLFSTGMLLLINFIVKYLYAIEFQYSVLQIILVSIAGIIQFLNMLINAILVAMRMFSIILKITLVSVTITLCITYPLTYQFDITGAYISYLLSSLFLLISSTYYVYRRENNVF